MTRNPFKRFYVWLYIMRGLIRKELKSAKRIPLSKKFWCWRKGFFSSSYVLYDLKNRDYRFFLSEYQENVKAIRLNDEYADQLDDKIKFARIIGEYLNVPDDIAILSNEKIVLLSGRYNITSLEDLYMLLKEKNVLILKPKNSASGVGVIRVSLIEGKIEYNKELITKEEFYSRLIVLDNYIVSSYISQAEYSEKIFPRTVNTIRIITMISPNDNVPFMAAAAHRFGTERSFPVDNCNAGGLTAKIDVNTGKLSSAIFTYFDGNELNWLDNHPDTGSPIKDVEIPGWDKIISGILSTASKISHLKYIGWDIVALKDGFVILEGNNGPDIKLHQVHEPLLLESQTREFFKFYGVVK
jgi:hypothetical protein